MTLCTTLILRACLHATASQKAEPPRMSPSARGRAQALAELREAARERRLALAWAPPLAPWTPGPRLLRAGGISSLSRETNSGCDLTKMLRWFLGRRCQLRRRNHSASQRRGRKRHRQTRNRFHRLRLL